MSRNLAVGLLAAWMALILAGPAPAQEPTTRPAPEPRLPPEVLAAGPATASGQLKMLDQIAGLRNEVGQLRKRLDEEVIFRVRWGFVLAGLALLGVLWICWSLRTLAKNQLELGRMIQALGLRKSD